MNKNKDADYFRKFANANYSAKCSCCGSRINFLKDGTPLTLSNSCEWEKKHHIDELCLNYDYFHEYFAMKERPTIH